MLDYIALCCGTSMYRHRQEGWGQGDNKLQFSILVPPSPCHLPPLHLIKRIFLYTWEKSRDIAIYVNKFPSIKHKPARYGIIKRLINVSLTFFHFRYFCVRFLGVSWQMKDKKTSIHHSGFPVIDGIKLSLPLLNIGSPIHKTSA